MVQAKIMVVEDDEQLNEVLCYNLMKNGYEPIAVFDGDEAVRQLEQTPPDLILLDIMLPGRSGWDVCQFLSESAASYASLPVVIFTAKSAREDFDKARRFPNFAGYFVKPYATQELPPPARWAQDRRPGSGGRFH
jgi:DNA-binding response OmpR family regulator